MRLKDVADGQQVEIPALSGNRTVGTYVESMGRERKNRCKRGAKSLRKIPYLMVIRDAERT